MAARTHGGGTGAAVVFVIGIVLISAAGIGWMVWSGAVTPEPARMELDVKLPDTPSLPEPAPMPNPQPTPLPGPTPG